LAPADDPWLLAALLPVEMGFMRPGGENVEQFAEYHRSKRLAEAVKQTVPRPKARSDAGLTAATAAAEFAAWLRARVPSQLEPPENLDELVEELADSWNLNSIDAVYATCSPHRVALSLLHMRNYYLHDYADQLVALLPDWTRWLATRNATAPELADRCLPYAHGQPHPPARRRRHEGRLPRAHHRIGRAQALERHPATGGSADQASRARASHSAGCGGSCGVGKPRLV
jgi:hypothetical protein